MGQIYICNSAVNVLLLGDQEADRGGGPIQSQEAGGDLKVQGGGGLIREREAEDLGAHPKPGNALMKPLNVKRT